MNRKEWTKKELEFLRKNYGLLSKKELEKQLGRSYSSISHKASREQIKSNISWTEEEIKILKNNYKIMTYTELGSLIGKTNNAVQMKLRKMGLHKEKYTYNRRFFQKIDSEEKAYWLGFIFADGCVTVNKTTNSGEVCIKLQKADYLHLKKFNKSLNGNIPVEFFDRLCSLNNKIQSCCSIRCYSIDMAQDLIKLGCVECKSFVKELPQLKDEFMRHFIRGYFDGNGCISTNSNKRETVSINFCCASKKFIEQLRTYLYSQNINSYIVDEKNRTTYRLYIKGMKNVDDMWCYMFNNSNIWLDRKYEKKKFLYNKYNLHERLLRLSEMTG